ncbi:MAG: hypothetical protein WCR55_01425 [Lentisphaerota bacterium]
MKLVIAIGILVTLFLSINCLASDADYKSVSSGVKYQYIGEYSTERLDKILTTELTEFTSFSVTYPPAENAVKLYKVIYNTVIPEQNNRPVTVSGLIALPEVKSKTLPLVSYQHGTIFTKTEVPSSPDNSIETRIMLAAFAGHGYIVIASDYIGVGESNEPNSWMVKESTAQACFDMLQVTQVVCADLGVTPGDLFLSGWSQGSFSTLAFLNRIETIGLGVKAAAMASSPNDIYLAFNRWIHVSSDLDVQWLVGTAAMLVFAYENYYNIPGLSITAIKPEYLKTAKDFYDFKIAWEEAAKKLPQKSKDLFQENFINESSFVTNPFYKQLQLNNSYNWRFKTPTRFYYGLIDEVVTPYMVHLPVEYQKTLGAETPNAVYAGDKANHRGTFLYGVKDQMAWFDSLRNN